MKIDHKSGAAYSTSILFGFLIIIMAARTGLAQELSPRAYWPAPQGTIVAVLGYQYSFGDVLTDPSLPLTGLDSQINVAYLGYLQTLGLFDRTANILIELPFTWGTTRGTILDPLGDISGQRDISGIADIGITLSVNLIGAPAMTGKEFQQLRRHPHPILGASLKILAPTGAYEADKLINVGSNRWAFKAKLGYIFPIKQNWLLEVGLGTWFFADNDAFLGVTREQKPIFAAELHLVKRFKPGFWAALDLNFFSGGRSIVGGDLKADLQRNSRIGGTIVYPFAGRHAVKAGFSMGIVTESGNDFKLLILGYQVLLN